MKSEKQILKKEGRLDLPISDDAKFRQFNKFHKITSDPLVTEWLDDPLRPDNPAQDFLQHKASHVGAPTTELKDILEFDSQNKPKIVLPRKQLSGKLAVGLILLGNSQTGLSMGDLVIQISKNWKKVKPTNISPILSQNGDWFFSEGERGNYTYRLSNKGRRELLETVSILKK